MTIFLNPGFVADAGSDFTAKIEPCTSSPSPLVQVLDEDIAIVSEDSKEKNNIENTKTELLVYPNPTRERAFVEFNLNKSTPVNLLAVSYTHLTLPTICSV